MAEPLKIMYLDVECPVYKIPAFEGTPEQRAHLTIFIDALRSGSYAQTKTVMRWEDKYCLLGVGCDASLLGEWTKINGSWYYADKSGDRGGCSMPGIVKDFYGLPDRSGFDVEGVFSPRTRLDTVSLPGLNDSGTPFSDLANILEAHINGGLDVPFAVGNL